jgi:AcrR family transcriptional regulator
MKVRTEARREAILEEAAKLFRELGYERASMNELAQRLGGSKATLYGYFPSKEALFVAVTHALADKHMGDAIAKLSAANSEEFEPALRRFGEAFVLLANESDALSVYRMVVGESGRSNVGDLFFDAGPRRVLESVVEFVRKAIARGDLRGGKPESLARQLLALLNAEAEDRLFQRDPAPLTRAQVRSMVDRALDVFLRGCANR